MKFNKKNILIIISILLVIIISIIIIVNKNNSASDTSKFSTEYKNVPINNKYKYVNINEAIDILQNKTGIVFMGFSECVWCQEYAKYLNEALLDKDIDSIYYLNIYKDRKKNTKKYKELLKILNNNLPYDDMGNHSILVPSTTFVKDGIVLYYDDETSYVNSEMNSTRNYWSDEKIKSFKDKINNYYNKIVEDNVCKDELGC